MDPRFKPIRPPGLRQKPVSIENKFVYLPFAKCASSTLMLFFKTAAKRCGATPRRQGVTRLAVVRHPVERVVSAYYFAWHNQGARRLWFNDWWQIVKDNPRIDMHTEPQADLCKLYSIDRAKESDLVYQLEEIDLWWPLMAQRHPDIFDRAPGRTNAAKVAKAPVEDKIRAEILEVYADDLSIWQQAALSPFSARNVLPVG
jgi:hypothetical protein